MDDYSLLLFPICATVVFFHCSSQKLPVRVCAVGMSFLFCSEVSVGGPALFVCLSKLAIDVPARNIKMHHCVAVKTLPDTILVHKYSKCSLFFLTLCAIISILMT